MRRHASTVLPGVPESVRAARELVRSVTGPDYTAELLVSELVTNAVIHSESGSRGGSLAVSVARGRRFTTIVVTDAGGADHPQVRHPAGSCPHGRGLGLVDRMSAAWGSRLLASGRRVTWCDIPAAAQAPQKRRRPQ
jgi:serine/threonine-protein kinase RsbW